LPLAYSTIQSATPAAAGTVSAQATALAKGVLTAMWVAKVVRLTAVAAAVVFAGAGLLATQAWADKPPAKEAKSDKLEGTWQVTSFIKDGIEGPKDDAEATKLVLSGESFTHIHAHADHEEKETGKFKVDATQKPATLDVEVTEGDKAGEGLVGIYKL